MRIFEKGGPLDPDEEAAAAPLPDEPDLLEAPEARGRSLGIFLLVGADLALGTLALVAIFWLFGARGYLVTESSDFGTEMLDALLGLKILVAIGSVLAGGFLLSALGVLSLRPIGYRLQALWAILLCLTVVGIPYGVVVLAFMKRRSTHARFFA
jgi:hypothetical protein